MDCILEAINDVISYEQAVKTGDIPNEAAQAKHLPETVAQHNSVEKVGWDGDVTYDGLEFVWEEIQTFCMACQKRNPLTRRCTPLLV
jgi:hypothetical protein